MSPRPISVVTDIDDDDDHLAPHLHSTSTASPRDSTSTLDDLDDLPTPADPPVQGPTGPHLFRSSLSSLDDNDYILAMSPLTPKPLTHAPASAFIVDPAPLPHPDPASEMQFPADWPDLPAWSPAHVAQYLIHAHWDPAIVDKFRDNDISGAILLTLKFDDLRELDIPSFGKRTQLWQDLLRLRDATEVPEPVLTPIDDTRSRAFGAEDTISFGADVSFGSEQFLPGQYYGPDASFTSNHLLSSHPDTSFTLNHLPSHPDTSFTSESFIPRRPRQRPRLPPPVSIIGIEQLMPKPHACSRGQHCSKYKKQQRLIEAFLHERPADQRPFSQFTTTPSIVASSDILGPSELPAIRSLDATHLESLQMRDPQSAVKQFLHFQHLDQDPPPSVRQSSHAALDRLTKLTIPTLPPRSQSTNTISPAWRARISPEPVAPDWPPRGGTPCSEMDIPLTAVPRGPVAREMSQSVPPNMNYHQPAEPIQRSTSRSSHRRPSIQLPSQQVLPPLHEGVTMKSTHRRRMSTSESLQDCAPPATNSPAPLARPALPATNSPAPLSRPAPPATNPLAPLARPASPAGTPLAPLASHPSHPDTTMSGWMKKRKTRLLRHEWHDRHFTLTGTRLAMHADASTLNALDYIDIDDYAVACSSLASHSKLNAAFKAMNLGKPRDEAAFAFQLVPAPTDSEGRLGVTRLLRALHDDPSSTSASTTAAKTKTHHFAVRNRDDRIDWMRELMLAKALRQKNAGYRVEVNGEQA